MGDHLNGPLARSCVSVYHAWTHEELGVMESVAQLSGGEGDTASHEISVSSQVLGAVE